MKKIVIFASGDVDKLVQRLKKGTPDLELVAGDIVTQKIRDEIQMLYPKNIEPTIERRRVKLANDLMQDRKEIVVIDTKKSAKFLEVYKESAATYDQERTTIALKITNGNIIDHSKELFLIKGDQYKVLQKIITKVHVLFPLPDTATEEQVNERKELLKVPAIVFTGIEAGSIEELEDAAITDANRTDLSLITIDANVADNTSRDFVTRLFERKSFAVINIEVTQEIPEEQIEEEPVINQNITDDSVKEKSQSPINEEIASEEDLTIFQDAWWTKEFPNTIFPWTKNKEARRAVIEARKKPITGNPDQLAEWKQQAVKLAEEKGIKKEEAKTSSDSTD